MAKKRGIRINITHQRIEALADLCRETLTLLAPADDHQCLLKEHLADLHHRLRGMATKEQEKYTLTMGSTEYMAFYQVCQLMRFNQDRYKALVVGDMLSKLSANAA
jgi:hypothetical protein